MLLLGAVAAAPAADPFVDVRPRVDVGETGTFAEVTTWSPDGRWLLVQGDDLRVYDAATMRVVRSRIGAGLNGRVLAAWPEPAKLRLAGCTYLEDVGRDRCWVKDWDLESDAWHSVAALPEGDETWWMTPDGAAVIRVNAHTFVRVGADRRMFPFGRPGQRRRNGALFNEVFAADAAAEHGAYGFGGWLATARAGDAAPRVWTLPEGQEVDGLAVLRSGDVLAVIDPGGADASWLARFPRGGGDPVVLAEVDPVQSSDRPLVLSPDESEVLVRHASTPPVVVPLDHPDAREPLGDIPLQSAVWGPRPHQVAGTYFGGFRVYEGSGEAAAVTLAPGVDRGVLSWLGPDEDRGIGGEGGGGLVLAGADGDLWRLDPRRRGPAERLRAEVVPPSPGFGTPWALLPGTGSGRSLLHDGDFPQRVALPSSDPASPVAWTELPETNVGLYWAWDPACRAFVTTLARSRAETALGRLWWRLADRTYDVVRADVPADGSPIRFTPLGRWWDAGPATDGSIVATRGRRTIVSRWASGCRDLSATTLRLRAGEALRLEADGGLLAFGPYGAAARLDPDTKRRTPLPLVNLGWDPDGVVPLARRQPDGSWETVALLELGSLGAARLVDLASGRLVRGGPKDPDFLPHEARGLAASPDGRFQIVSDATGARTILDLDRMAVVGWLYLLGDGEWAVLDPDGRFDASDRSVWSRLYYVHGMEPIALEQIAHRYYEPGLLARLLGQSTEPPLKVTPLREAPLPPAVTWTLPSDADPWLRVTVTPRSSGLGRVAVRVNGTEITPDLRRAEGVELAASGAEVHLAWPRANIDAWVDPTRTARMDVVAFGKDGWSSSRATEETYAEVGGASGAPARLRALVIGVEDYPGVGLDLDHPEADAAAMATFLQAGGNRIFNETEVHVLTTGGASVSAPNTANLTRELRWLQETRPQDVVVLFLSGHGMAAGSPRDFYFLTSDATQERVDNADDAAGRASWTLSGAQLKEALREVKAHKAVILDTCHAGQFGAEEDARDPVSDRALADLERTAGAFVLAGSSGDGRSYEAAALGHGVLTWSLLGAMQAPPDPGGTWDVLTLFGDALKVATLQADRLGLRQQPELRALNGGQSFTIGRVNPDIQGYRLKSQRPVYTRSSFQQDGPVPVDRLRLSWKIDGALAQLRARDVLAWYPGEPRPGVRQIAGRYSVADGALHVEAMLIQDDTQSARVFDRPVAEVDALATEIAAWAAGVTP